MAPTIFFRFDILIFIYLFKYKTIETHARAFLPLNISTVGSVGWHQIDQNSGSIQNFYLTNPN